MELSNGFAAVRRSSTTSPAVLNTARFPSTKLPWFGFARGVLKSTAVSDAGLTKQSLYEVERSNFTRETYDRAIECMDAVNFEVQGLIHRAWGRL